MIRKKLLSVCLALALCLSLLPTMALADDTHSDHAVCVSEGNCTNSDHADSHGTVTWTAWTDIDSLPNSTGSYYLTADVTISATWEVPTGETQLCLNGHTIKYENSTAQGSVIKVPDEATLTITDCASTPGKITGGTGTDTNYSNTSPILSDSYFGGGIFVEGTLNLYGGNIEGNRIPSDNSPRHGGGGGIFVNGTNACFNMYGGVVQDNEAYGAGAGVLCYQSRFNMYGGEITKHSQKVYNGAVCLDTDSTMIMTGGTIAENTGSDELIYVCKDAKLIVDGEKTNFVVGVKGDVNIYAIIPKSDNGWKLGMSFDTKRVIQKISDGVTIYMYQYKNTDDYYITVLDTNGGLSKISDNLGSEFQYLDKSNSTLNKTFYTYYAYINNFNDQYTLTVNDKTIKVQN